ncbi:MAG: hypothetical protein ABIH78_00655 [Candidatus Peregrinibacteria bacterium]
MDKKTLQNQILKLLETSTIPRHDKVMVKILINAMDEGVLNKIFEALKNEATENEKLEQKRTRIKMKYDVMVEKLSDMEIKKYT